MKTIILTNVLDFISSISAGQVFAGIVFALTSLGFLIIVGQSFGWDWMKRKQKSQAN